MILWVDLLHGTIEYVNVEKEKKSLENTEQWLSPKEWNGYIYVGY